jgi:hypothetical protein
MQFVYNSARAQTINISAAKEQIAIEEAVKVTVTVDMQGEEAAGVAAAIVIPEGMEILDGLDGVAVDSSWFKHITPQLDDGVLTLAVATEKEGECSGECVIATFFVSSSTPADYKLEFVQADTKAAKANLASLPFLQRGSLMLKVGTSPHAGDFNGDNKVDATDFLALVNGWGTDYNTTHFLALVNNWGFGT